jgi:hypothetical protein
MKLPVIDTRPIYSTFLPVQSREVQFKPYSTGEEKTFLIALDNDDDKLLYINLRNLIKNCMMTDEIDFKTISIIDLMKLVFVIRSKSKSEALNLQMKCPVEGCNTITKITIPDIETTLKIKNNNVLRKTVKITDLLAIEVKPMAADYMQGFLQLMKKESKSNEEILNLGLNSIIYNINKVFYEIDGKQVIYSSKDYDPEELKVNVIENLTDRQLKEISDGINQLISMYVEVPFKCSKCGHEEVIHEENFFVLL